MTKAITTGRLADALQPFFPTVNDAMIRAWIDEGKLIAYRNPLNPAGWHKLDTDSVKDLITNKLGLTREQITTVLEALEWSEHHV